MSDDTFPARLKRLMQEKKMTASQIARKIYGEVEEPRVDRKGNLYITKAARGRQVVRGWEIGRSEPSPENKQKLAEALGVPISALDPQDLRGGVRVSPVEEDGRVLVEMSIRLPAHIAQTVWEIVERHRR